MKNCYKDLPEGYTLAKVIDAKGDKKFIIGIQAVTFLLTVASAALLIYLTGRRLSFDGINPKSFESLIWMFGLCLAIFAYMILHELTHGIVYKICTGEKLKFGLTLTVAYCGVPNVYVNKKTALLALGAPLIVFSIAFLLGALLAKNVYASIFFGLLFGIHFGGCSGDMYDIILLVFKYKGDVLINDNGPTQKIFIK